MWSVPQLREACRSAKKAQAPTPKTRPTSITPKVFSPWPFDEALPGTTFPQALPVTVVATVPRSRFLTMLVLTCATGAVCRRDAVVRRTHVDLAVRHPPGGTACNMRRRGCLLAKVKPFTNLSFLAPNAAARGAGELQSALGHAPPQRYTRMTLCLDPRHIGQSRISSAQPTHTHRCPQGTTAWVALLARQTTHALASIELPSRLRPGAVFFSSW